MNINENVNACVQSFLGKVKFLPKKEAKVEKIKISTYSEFQPAGDALLNAGSYTELVIVPADAQPPSYEIILADKSQGRGEYSHRKAAIVRKSLLLDPGALEWAYLERNAVSGSGGKDFFEKKIIPGIDPGPLFYTAEEVMNMWFQENHVNPVANPLSEDAMEVFCLGVFNFSWKITFPGMQFSAKGIETSKRLRQYAAGVVNSAKTEYTSPRKVMDSSDWRGNDKYKVL